MREMVAPHTHMSVTIIIGWHVPHAQVKSNPNQTILRAYALSFGYFYFLYFHIWICFSSTFFSICLFIFIWRGEWHRHYFHLHNESTHFQTNVFNTVFNIILQYTLANLTSRFATTFSFFFFLLCNGNEKPMWEKRNELFSFLFLRKKRHFSLYHG